VVCSMTAFSRVRKERAGYAIAVEIRTLNSKGLDIIVRLPKNGMEWEESLRKLVAQFLRRGRTEVYVGVEATTIEHRAPRINEKLARFYWDQLQTLYRQLPGTDPPRLADILRIPHIFEAREVEEDLDSLRDLIVETVTETLEGIKRMRCQEGEALLRDCLARLASLRQELGFVDSRKDATVVEYQKRLRERMAELLGGMGVDESRLLQEVACMADRADINEEIVRFQSHLDQMEGLLTGTAPTDGRTLDFLTQELHRETNTLGCKSGDLETVQAVVRMKSEIGKLKEQIQNIE